MERRWQVWLCLGWYRLCLLYHGILLPPRNEAPLLQVCLLSLAARLAPVQIMSDSEMSQRDRHSLQSQGASKEIQVDSGRDYR